MLDLEAGKWSIRAPLPMAKFAGGAVHSGRYFAITLHTDDVPTIYAYQPSTDTWELQSPLAEPVPGSGHGRGQPAHVDSAFFIWGAGRSPARKFWRL